MVKTVAVRSISRFYDRIEQTAFVLKAQIQNPLKTKACLVLLDLHIVSNLYSASNEIQTLGREAGSTHGISIPAY